MTTYTESKEITTKTEYNDCDMIGWSVLDSSPIYRATVTRFSIAEGIISQYVKIVNKNGSDYKPAAYRNTCNGFTPSYII